MLQLIIRYGCIKKNAKIKLEYKEIEVGTGEAVIIEKNELNCLYIKGQIILGEGDFAESLTDHLKIWVRARDTEKPVVHE
jgi:hypothetical protein